MTGVFKGGNLLRISSLREGFSADSLSRPFGKAIFMARIASMKDCFVPRNDDLSFESINSSGVEQQIIFSQKSIKRYKINRFRN
jgi:hypothetical protein